MLCPETRLFELACQDAKFYHKGDKYGTHDYYEYHLLGVVAFYSNNLAFRFQIDI